MKQHWIKLVIVVLLLGSASFALAQWGRNRRMVDIRYDRRGVPTWEVDERFPGDLFTFVRVRYDSYYGRGRRRRLAHGLPRQ